MAAPRLVRGWLDGGASSRVVGRSAKTALGAAALRFVLLPVVAGGGGSAPFDRRRMATTARRQDELGAKHSGES